MTGLDWAVVAVYLVGTMAGGVALARRASGGLEDFFVGGRSLPWWLAGTSMAATTFSIDTPLYVAGVVGARGIAGNWEWWSFAVAHVILLYVFARLWNRAQVVTDNELSELRYGGSPAAILRGVKGFLYAVVLGSIGIGLAMLAMVKVVEALELLPSLGIELGDQGRLWTVVGVAAFVLVYAGIAGLWGVVVTDFIQFVLGLFGAIVVAVYAVADVGGLGALVEQAGAWPEVDLLAFTPLEFDGGWIPRGWSMMAGISGSTFLAYVTLQWWAFRRSDGGGEFVQRLAAARSEEDAERAAWLFNLLHYVLRTWPWVLVALAAVVLYPDLQDRELGYPRLMLDFLPAGLLGLVVASLVAAFMSTVSTLINWSASYLTSDVYARFVRPDAGNAELVLAGRIASVAVTALGALAAFFAEDVTTLFRLIIAVGTGPGLVLILRWFWWRVNAWTELAAMLAGFVVGLGTSVVPVLRIDDFGLRLFVTSLVSVALWLPVMIVTPPESERTLRQFYRRVRPGGPGWSDYRRATRIPAAGNLGRELLRVVAGLALLFGLMFGVGGGLLLRPWVAGLNALLAVAGWIGLRALRTDASGPPPVTLPGAPGRGRPGR
jgi:SSS family solute:Na+ symporter